VATHSLSELYVELRGATRFIAEAGVDDTSDQPDKRMVFQVIADGRLIWQSRPLAPRRPAVMVDLDVAPFAACCCASTRGRTATRPTTPTG
jgi:hypothetical protein